MLVLVPVLEPESMQQNIFSVLTFVITTIVVVVQTIILVCVQILTHTSARNQYPTHH